MFKTASEGRPNAFASSNSYSSDLVDFIQSMLTYDPLKRPTISELLKHKFLEVADTRRNMENVLSKIFISNIVGITGF